MRQGRSSWGRTWGQTTRPQVVGGVPGTGRGVPKGPRVLDPGPTAVGGSRGGITGRDGPSGASVPVVSEDPTGEGSPTAVTKSCTGAPPTSGEELVRPPHP